MGDTGVMIDDAKCFETVRTLPKSVESMLRRSLRAAAILGACCLVATGFACSKSLAEPPGAARIDYGMPERLGRRVAPVPSAPWRSPDLRGYTSVLKAAEPSPIDLQKRYDLVERIDLAQRLAPETRVAWEAARQAAIGVGLVEGGVMMARGFDQLLDILPFDHRGLFQTRMFG
jgi:hypothetical protein